MTGARTIAVALAILLLVACLAGCQAIQRKLLFHPTHGPQTNDLTTWTLGGRVIGYAREVAEPENVWLMLHGNGGQAADRAYALPRFSPRDSVFILEYPGYGMRAGKPARRTIDAAAREAYGELRRRFPATRVCVAAESIGSGPAAVLAGEARPPDKFVFVVPFDDLAAVARHHVRFVPVSLLLAGAWNNVDALAGYSGPLEIFGAERDEVIPVARARALAASRPQAVFHLIPGTHNGWADQPAVRFRCL